MYAMPKYGEIHVFQESNSIRPLISSYETLVQSHSHANLAEHSILCTTKDGQSQAPD